jgi:MFS family permease
VSAPESRHIGAVLLRSSELDRSRQREQHHSIRGVGLERASDIRLGDKMRTLQDREPHAPTSPRQLVFLLTLALVINYIDRGNLATAGPLLSEELKLSGTQLGTLLSAFYVAYASTMVPAGWFADRYGARLALGLGFGLWSLATLLTGFAGGFLTILALRLLLGFGESPVFPSTSKLIRSSVEPARIGIANGVIGFGYQIGPAVGTLVGGLLMTRIGWRAVFVLFGALSLLWLIPWSGITVHERTTRRDAGCSEVVPFGAILRQRALWGASIGNFGVNYSFFFTLAWLPTYLVKARGFSMDEMATIATPAYALCAVAAVVGGFGIDRWVRAGRSPNAAHKGLMALSYITGIATMVGIVLLPRTGSIACLFVYEFFGGLASPCIFAVAQIFAGPGATARWVGVQNLCGNLAGILAPALTGILVDLSGSYVSAFVVAGIANVVGFIGWLFVMPKVTPIHWDTVARGRSVALGGVGGPS